MRRTFHGPDLNYLRTKQIPPILFSLQQTRKGTIRKKILSFLKYAVLVVKLIKRLTKTSIKESKQLLRLWARDKQAQQIKLIT